MHIFTTCQYLQNFNILDFLLSGTCYINVEYTKVRLCKSKHHYAKRHSISVFLKKK